MKHVTDVVHEDDISPKSSSRGYLEPDHHGAIRFPSEIFDLGNEISLPQSSELNSY